MWRHFLGILNGGVGDSPSFLDSTFEKFLYSRSLVISGFDLRVLFEYGVLFVRLNLEGFLTRMVYLLPVLDRGCVATLVSFDGTLRGVSHVWYHLLPFD